MTRPEIVRQLNVWIRAWAIDPYDARMILAEIDSDGLDRETFAEYLEGQGYPNLATELLHETASV